jgi:ABC-type transport system substrate-binding protein
VAHGQGRAVERLDTRNGHPLSGSVQVGAGATGIAVTPEGVWVANQAGLSVTHLTDTDDQVATTTVQVGDGPTAVLAVKNQLWVADEYDGTISQLDRATNRVLHRYSIGGSPHGLALAGSDVWVTSDAFTGGSHVGGTLVVDAACVPGCGGSGIDPASIYVTDGISAERPVYDGLVAFRAQGGTAGITLVPDLAVDLPIPTDHGRTYTFTVRKDIQYSTGEVMQASDLLRGLRRELIIGRANGRPDFFFGILGAQDCSRTPTSCDRELRRGVDVDDATGLITFHLSAPDPTFLDKLTYFVYAVPPRPDIEAKTIPLPATGPYQISHYVPDKTLVLTRNPFFKQWSFTAQPAGYPDEIVYREPPTPVAEVNDVVAGRADIVDAADLDTAQLLALERSYPAQLPYVSAFNMNWITLNTTTPPFTNANVRRAINDAVDRRVIAGLAGGDQVGLPTCQLLPQGFPGYRFNCPYADSDFAPKLAEAKALVAGSGTAGMTITLYARTQASLGQRIQHYLAGVLEDLGYKVKTRLVNGDQWLSFLRDPRNRVQAAVGTGWTADYPASSTFFEDLATCRSIHSVLDDNFSFYCNPAVDRAINAAEALDSTDQVAADLAWGAAERQVLLDAPIIPTLQGRSTWFISSRLGNFQATPLQFVLYSQMWIK